MKFTNLFFSAFVLLTLAACSKDEPETISVNTSDLVGTWNLVSLECNDGTTVSEAFGVKSTATFITTGKDYNAKATFSSNPNKYLSQGTYTSITKTTTSGQTETEETPFEDFAFTGTWKVEGNKLIVSNTGEPDQIAEITKFDAKSLEYKTVINEVVDFAGFKVTVKGTYITKMSR